VVPGLVRCHQVNERYKPFPPRWAHVRVPASSRAAALAALTLYAPCRTRGLAVRWAAWAMVRIGGTGLLPGRARTWDPPLDASDWSALLERWRELVGDFDALAVYERPQPMRQGVAVLLIASGEPVGFVKLRQGGDQELRSEQHALDALARIPPRSFWAPDPLASGHHSGWRYLLTSALPSRLDRPPSAPDLAAITADIERALGSTDRPTDVPAHWRPMHGDLTPWNLRDIPEMGLALIDWEDAGWGPPDADAVLYRAATAALFGGPIRAEPREAVAFWQERVAHRPVTETDRFFRGRLSAVLDQMITASGRTTAPASGRMRVLMGAFGCQPKRGSEPEVGYRALMAAASRCDVHLLTTPGNAAALEKHLAGHPLRSRMTVEAVPLGISDDRIDHVGLLGFHAFYDLWQRRAARRAAALAAEGRFDVAHHVTVAAYWTRAGVAASGLPLVWGPVGGGVEPPWSLAGILGARGLAGDLLRVVSRRLLRHLGSSRRAADAAMVTLAQNAETAAVVRARVRIEVLPNATAVDLGDFAFPEGPRRADMIFAGRIVAWKGGILALRALRHLEHPEATLRVFGSGPDRRRLRRAARRLGVAHRVRFEERVPRDSLLTELATAGLLLHPAIHDESPLVVAEALSLGTPVVCLDHGGPAELVRHWPAELSRAVPPRGVEDTARRLGAAMDLFLAEPRPVPTAPIRPDARFSDRLLAAYHAAASVGAVGRPPP
jgi:glycosyltransferase involved in cell wall biosynthesis